MTYTVSGGALNSAQPHWFKVFELLCDVAAPQINMEYCLVKQKIKSTSTSNSSSSSSSSFCFIFVFFNVITWYKVYELLCDVSVQVKVLICSKDTQSTRGFLCWCR